MVLFKKYILIVPSLLFLLLQWIGKKSTNNWCDLQNEYYFSENLELLRSERSVSGNYFDNQYLQNPKTICNFHAIDILSVVKSAPGNFKIRMAIRKRWGRMASSGRNKLVFSLGKTQNLTYQSKIDDEMKRFEDILQGTFVDTYKNLTLKTINSIQWVSKYCSRAKFVLFVDEDVLVNFRNLQSFLQNLPVSERDQLLTGYVVNDYPSPNRFETKFAISLEDYPLPCFPMHISGPVVLASGKMVKVFATAIPYVKPIIFEDVYLGIVASKLGIKLSPVNNDLFDPHGTGLHRWSSIISSHQGNRIYGKMYI